MNFKILVAPASFKEFLSAKEVAKIIEECLRKFNFIVEKAILSDGGDGFIEMIKEKFKFEEIKIKVKNPLLDDFETYYLFDDKIAVIEYAKVCGLALIPPERRNPLNTTSYGVGQVIMSAIENGAKEVWIGAGGSATCDAGAGALSALGVKFKDNEGKVLKFPVGRDLIKISSYEIEKNFNVKFKIFVDVDNPLYGKEGAAYVYAPQKGAGKEEVKLLDEGLKNFALLFSNGIIISKEKGMGACGGFPFGFKMIFDAEIINGTDFAFKLWNIEEKIKECDAVITGEGKFDKQSFYGKITGRLKSLCDKYGKRFFVICGKSEIKEDYVYEIDEMDKNEAEKKIKEVVYKIGREI